jgi:hypothetical protein
MIESGSLLVWTNTYPKIIRRCRRYSGRRFWVYWIGNYDWRRWATSTSSRWDDSFSWYEFSAAKPN